MAEEIARRIYFSRIRELRDRFQEQAHDLRRRKGVLSARDALRFAQTEDSFKVFHEAFQRLLEEIQGYGGRKVVIAPIPYGGEFVGNLMHDIIKELRSRGVIDKDVELLPIEKSAGLQFDYKPPSGEHLFVLVDDVRGTGRTIRQIKEKHPNPENVRAIYLSRSRRGDKYMYAKMLATLSYLHRAIKGEPDMLDELVEKKKNKGAYIVGRSDSWRVGDL
jgi:hypoxanthine phosphoribosyltransferase